MAEILGENRRDHGHPATSVVGQERDERALLQQLERVPLNELADRSDVSSTDNRNDLKSFPALFIKIFQMRFDNGSQTR
ncbi:hypothetical protein XM48_00110 [Leucobacter sp. Ag1]|nr:hypothetical protein XM48_00110 [Leucobacter sp. Ag1]